MLFKHLCLIFAIMFVGVVCFGTDPCIESGVTITTGYVQSNDDYEGLSYFHVYHLDITGPDYPDYYVVPNKFANITVACIDTGGDEEEYYIENPSQTTVTLTTWCSKPDQNPGAYFLILYEDTTNHGTLDIPGDYYWDSKTVSVDND